MSTFAAYITHLTELVKTQVETELELGWELEALTQPYAVLNVEGIEFRYLGRSAAYSLSLCFTDKGRADRFAAAITIDPVPYVVRPALKRVGKTVGSLEYELTWTIILDHPLPEAPGPEPIATITFDPVVVQTEG